jgi:dihydroorotate dehydrogenase
MQGRTVKAKNYRGLIMGVVIRALHLLPPETAHRLALSALGRGLVPRRELEKKPRLATTVFGLEFENPLGLAAGFDKSGKAIRGCLDLGFGFVEIGTVTPRPQAGNPKPRLFRLPQQRALINRMGFNNDGLEAVRERLARRDPAWGPVGANLGANRDTGDPIGDYVAGLRGVYREVDYVAINVSSPNTPGLRQLQTRARLDALLSALLETRAELAGGERPKPLLVKLAPDLAADDEAEIAEVALARSIDGLIIGNTTIARPSDRDGHWRGQAGGLSGPPLLDASTAQLRRFFRLTSGRLPLIGVGGVSRGADAYAKVRAGASLLQIYTALVYRGPSVIGRILAELDRLLERDGCASLVTAVGRDALA